MAYEPAVSEAQGGVRLEVDGEMRVKVDRIQPAQAQHAPAFGRPRVRPQGNRIILKVLRPCSTAYAMLLPTETLCRGARTMADPVNASIVEHFHT